MVYVVEIMGVENKRNVLLLFCKFIFCGKILYFDNVFFYDLIYFYLEVLCMYFEKELGIRFLIVVYCYVINVFFDEYD